MRHCPLLAVACFAVLCAVPAQTQLVRPGGGYTMHRNVSVVTLDGVAIDAQGNPVTDLTRNDFKVEEDGVPMKIRFTFDIPGEYTPAADVTIDSTAELDRLAPHAPVNIVLLDEFTTRFEDMAFARYSLKKWLDAQPVKLDTPTMLIAVSLNKFTVLRDYTQNKDEILNALNNHFAVYPWHAQDVTWSEELYANAHLALQRVAEATAGHHGHKTMIWIGRGFPSNRRDHFSKNPAESGSVTADTLDALRDARVTLYTIDPAGVEVHPELSYYTPWYNYWPFGGDPQFQALAMATGGRNFYNRNDVETEIGSAIRDGKSFYTLSYSPPDPDNNPGKLRHIKVTIDRPGVRFVSRTAYYPASRPPRVYRDGKAGTQLLLEMAAAGNSNMQYDSVGFTVTASPDDANDMRIHLDGIGVSYYIPDQHEQPFYTRFIVLAMMFDQKGIELKEDGRVFKFNAPVGMAHPGKDHLPMDIDFKLPPVAKAAKVRFVVRVEASGTMGTADLPIVPGAKANSSATEAVQQVTLVSSVPFR
jgi:VWFA-related protein